MAIYEKCRLDKRSGENGHVNIIGKSRNIIELKRRLASGDIIQRGKAHLADNGNRFRNHGNDVAK